MRSRWPLCPGPSGLGSYRPGRGPVNVHSFRRLQSGTLLARSPGLHETKELVFVVKLREGDHHAAITSPAVHLNPHRVRPSTPAPRMRSGMAPARRPRPSWALPRGRTHERPAHDVSVVAGRWALEPRENRARDHCSGRWPLRMNCSQADLGDSISPSWTPPRAPCRERFEPVPHSSERPRPQMCLWASARQTRRSCWLAAWPSPVSVGSVPDLPDSLARRSPDLLAMREARGRGQNPLRDHGGRMRLVEPREVREVGGAHGLPATAPAFGGARRSRPRKTRTRSRRNSSRRSGARSDPPTATPASARTPPAGSRTSRWRRSRPRSAPTPIS